MFNFPGFLDFLDLANTPHFPIFQGTAKVLGSLQIHTTFLEIFELFAIRMSSRVAMKIPWAKRSSGLGGVEIAWIKIGDHHQVGNQHDRNDLPDFSTFAALAPLDPMLGFS